jgi:L-gulonate 5-dehydrogenase
MEVRETTEPLPDAGQAVVSVEAVGLCGSDFHLFHGTHPYARFPQTQGHEFVGVVEEFGPRYDGPVSVGQRVAVEPLIPCGRCFACRRGRYNCCVDLKVMGAHVAGALAEKVAVRASALYPVGDLPARVAVLAEPMSIGLQCVVRAEVTAGDTVVVIGAGPIGQAVVLSAVDRGARVLVTDRIGSRLDMATRLGAERVVDTGAEDLDVSVSEFTRGDGAAVVVEATGVPALLRGAFELVAHSGTIVVVGISDQEVSIPVIEFSRKEVDVLGSRNNSGIFADAVDLVRRHRDRVAALVTHTFPLAEVPAAIEYAMNNPQDVQKLVITVGGEA